jgi:hypothetical protein
MRRKSRLINRSGMLSVDSISVFFYLPPQALMIVKTRSRLTKWLRKKDLNLSNKVKERSSLYSRFYLLRMVKFKKNYRQSEMINEKEK